MAKCGQAVHRTVSRRRRLHLPRAEEADSYRISAMVRGRTLAFLAAFSGVGASGLGQKLTFGKSEFSHLEGGFGLMVG